MSYSYSKTKEGQNNSIAGFPAAVVGSTTINPNVSFNSNDCSVYAVKISDSINAAYALISLSSACTSDTDTDTLSDIEFNTVSKLYSLTNKEDLKRYLTFNTHLYSTLINGHEVVKKRLGDKASLSLELYTYIDGGAKSIFLTIHIDEDIDDDLEDEIVHEILTFSSTSLDGKIVISFY